jgi:hypothetical protein
MKVGDLKIDDTVTIKLRHWHNPMRARVIGKCDEYDQLHGDFMHHATTFRKIKCNGRESYMFTLADETEPTVLAKLREQNDD